jgi:hypothetical protein
MNPATDTLTGTYVDATLKMPDGSEVPMLVRKVLRGDGSFGYIVLDDTTLEFEKRFAKTTTIPNDLLSNDTDVLVQNPIVKNNQVDENEESTKIRLIQADALLYLGDPRRVVAQNGLDPEVLAYFKEHRATATFVRRICKNLGGIWSKAAEFVPTHFPDRPENKKHG